jgi:cation:H+ antiporter
MLPASPASRGHDSPAGRSWLWLGLTLVLPLPAILLRFGVVSLAQVPATAVYGLAILSAAFILTWAAEAAERDIAQSLALAFLALVAVLPEYAVDMSFAWKAGHDPAYAAYAAANMTGGNRLLVGVGWASVVGVYWLVNRRSLLTLAQHHALELSFLLLATLYSFTIPLKGSLSPLDSVVLIGLFVVYLWLAARNPSEEDVALVGPAASLGALPPSRRRIVVGGLFLYAAACIAIAAEEFATGLVETGAQLGVDRFLLVQWVAPLASEAPEFIAAILLTLRNRAGVGLGALLSSKVNQWTLLVGGLPLAYSLARGAPASLPLDSRQVEELLLTAAQSAFAVAVLVSLSISLKEASLLLGLFVAQFVLQDPAVRYAITALYLVLTVGMAWRQRDDLRALWRWWRQGRPHDPASDPLRS